MLAEGSLSQEVDVGRPKKTCKFDSDHPSHANRGSFEALFHKLAPETLHLILVIVLKLDEGHTPSLYSQMRPAAYYGELYDLRLVCKRWNEVIVSSPRFWSLVDLSRGERGVRMVLDRAGAIWPLLVVCWQATGNLDKVVELMLPQMHRVRNLQVVLTDTQFQSFSPIIRCKAPLLHHAGLSCLTSNDVQGALFKRETPRLQSLFLSGVVADWNTQTFPHVASLNLSFITTTTEDLLALLMGCPRLVSVYLDSIIFTRQKPDVEEPIFLPDLQSFTIRSLQSPHVARLLSRLQAPCCKIWCIHDVAVGSYPPAIVFGPFMEQVSAAAKGRSPLTPAWLELGQDRIVCKFGGKYYRLGICLPMNDPFWDEVLMRLVAIWGDGRGREVKVESFGWLAPSSPSRLDLPSGWKVVS